MKFQNKILYSQKYFIVIMCLVIITSFISCGEKNKLDNSGMISSHHYDQYSDSSFVDSKISSITEDNGKFFICEQTSKRIVVLDDKMIFKYSIGKGGEGPGEFKYPVSCAVKNDSLYVLDAGKSKMIIYRVDGRFIREYNVTQAPPRGYNFGIIDNGTIAISLLNKDNPLHLLSNGKIVYSFGQYMDNKSEIGKIRNGQRHVGIINDYIVSLPEAETFVELFDNKGNCVSKFDLSKIEQVKNVIRYYKNRIAEEKDPAAVYVYFMGISVYKNFVYLLLNNLTDKKKFASLIVLELKGKELSLKNFYALVDSNGKEINLSHALSANNENIIIANRSGLHVFNLK